MSDNYCTAHTNIKIGSSVMLVLSYNTNKPVIANGFDYTGCTGIIAGYNNYGQYLIKLDMNGPSFYIDHNFLKIIKSEHQCHHQKTTN